MRGLRVLYWRVDDRGYPRNTRIRAYLGSLDGIAVEVIDRARTGSKAVRALTDLWRLAACSRAADVIVVSEFSLAFAPFARAITALRGSRLVVDGFVGKHETLVGDWGVHGGRSLAARWWSFVDATAVRCADLCLTDTVVRADGLRRAHGTRVRVMPLPVGAPSWAVPRRPAPPADHLRVLFYGSVLPLHGLPLVFDAIALLEDTNAVFTFVCGARLDEARRLARDRGVEDRCRFANAVPEETLAGLIEDHDVVLGTFGDSAKARSVIANKVWQSLAVGRTVITRRSTALAEIRDVASSQLVEVDDALELAATIDSFARGGVPHARPGLHRELEGYVLDAFARFGEWLRGGPRIRVLHAVDSMTGGGAQQVVLDLTRWTADEGVETAIFGAPGVRDVDVAHPVGFVPATGASFLGYVRQLHRTCTALRPTILHAHQRREALACLVVARFHGIPVVEHAHTVLPSRRMRTLSFRTRRIFSVGASVTAMLTDVFCVSPERIATIGNPVPRAALSDAGHRDRVAAGELVVLGAGRLETQKDPLRFVDTVASVESAVTLRAVWYGSGPMLAEAREYAEACRAPVSFAGSTTTLLREMDRADALLLTSRWEGTPLVVLEAFARGLLVIAYEAPGVTELVAGRGVLIPAGAGPGQVSRILVNALASGGDRERANARRYAEEYADPSRVFGPVLDVYQQLTQVR